MKSKEIYQAIDLSKVGPELKTKLIALEKATNGFTNERADGNMDMAMNKIYAHLKDKKPESLKNIEVKTIEVEEKVETIVEGKPVKKTTKTKKKVAGKKKKVAKKTATPSSGLKKPTVSSVASKIRKPNESWSDALSRAKVIFNEKKQTQVAKTKKAVDDLRDFLKDDKNFTGWPRTYGKEKPSDNSLERDSQRKAMPPGKRRSDTGRVYYENRDNRADREANSFPRKIFLKEGGDIMIEPTILQNNPDYLVGTETMYEMFAKGGITSRGLFKIQDEVYEKLKFESGSEIKSTSENRYKFSKAVDDALKARGVAKESLSKRIYDKLEDENAHTLNEFLILNDYFEPSVWPEGKKFYFERFKENPRSGLGKDGIVGATTKAPKGTSKGYISHDNIKLIIIKNPNSNGKKKFLQIDGSDVLNGVYDSNAFAKGGTLPKGYKYIRRADVNQVVTKKNEIIFNTKNGFWVDENALTTAETKFEAGGEVFIPTTYLDYNPDYLVGTNTMYEMFAKGGTMDLAVANPDELYKRLSEAEKNFQKDNGAEYKMVLKEIEDNRIFYFQKLSEAEKNYLKDNGAEYKRLISMRNKFEKGGGIGFEGLSKKVAARYVGKSVKPKFQAEYGKTYSSEEASEVGDKVAAKVYRQQQQKMAKGGVTTNSMFTPYNYVYYNSTDYNYPYMLVIGNLAWGISDEFGPNFLGNIQREFFKSTQDFANNHGYRVLESRLPENVAEWVKEIRSKEYETLRGKRYKINPNEYPATFAKGGQIKSPYIVTFGFQGDDEYEIAKSKPIFAENEDEAAIMLKDQFESFEGTNCDIIRVKKMADGGSIPEGYHQMPDGSIMADSAHMAKGGYVDLQANLMKELQKLQRDLNSPRLSRYTEGDNSQEEIARQRERASKLARFNEILDLLRELESKKMADGGSIEFEKGGVVIYKELDLNRRDGKVKKTQITTAENYREALDKIKQLESKNKNPNVRYFTGDIYEKGGFVAMYGGKKINIEADSLYAAKLKAIEEFKVPKSKQGLLSVVSNKSLASQDFRFMANGGIMAKGGKIREFDDVLIISKNKLGMVEAIADNIYYVTTPFGESFEAALDDLQKVKSFSKGGAMEHMILLGDKVLDIYKNVLIVQSVSGGVTVIDFRQEPIARRILVERITGKNTLASAKDFIDTDPSFKTITMAMGGSLQGHGLEVGDLIVEDLGGYIKVMSEDGKEYFIKLRDGDRLTEPPLPFERGGEVKIGDIARLAAKYNKTGQEVTNAISKGADVEVEHTEDRKKAMRIAVDHLEEDFYYYTKLKAVEGEIDLTEFYEGGGNVPKVFDVPAQFLDAEGKRKNDKKTIKELTDFVLGLPQTKSIYYNDNLGGYTPSRKKLHAEIINKFKKEVVCINNDKPIAIFMGGSPASGKSSFLRKYSPFLLKEEILKIDADEIRAMLPEYEGWNATQTHLETKDIVNTLLSNKNIGIPCDFDIIYDGTMNSVKSYIPLMDILRKRGYKIFIVFMDNVPKDVIIKRALDRYKSSGRFVPLEVIEDFFTKGKSAFNELKKDVDGYMRIDGSSQDYKVLEEGGMKLPRDREYSKLGTKIKASDIPISYKKGGLSLL